MIVVYFIVNSALSPANQNSYLLTVAKNRLAEGMGVSSFEHSLDGFPFFLFAFPIILIPIVYLINKMCLGLNKKITLVNIIIVFVFATVFVGALYYYNNYGNAILSHCEALGPNIYIPEPPIVDLPTVEH